MEFQGFQECLVLRNRRDRRGEMELMGRLATRGHKGCWDKKERREMKGLVARADRQE